MTKRLTPTVPATLGFVCLLTLSACGFPKAPMRPTLLGASEDGFVAANVTPPEGMTSDPPQPMSLYPGDVISVTTVSAETTTMEGLVVDEVGQVHLPLAGNVRVGDMDLEQARVAIKNALRAFDRFVEVSVRLTEAAGHRVTVLGAVPNPGQLSIVPGARVADVIAAAGGPLAQATEEGELLQLANLDGARVFRAGQALPISVTLAMQGHPRHNVRIRPGDHVHIPPRIIGHVAVLGAVQAAAIIPFFEGMRLTEALAATASTTIDADQDDIRILRGSVEDMKVYHASLDDIVDGDSHDVVLAPGDVVFVTDHWIADVGEVLNRLAPVLATGTTVGVTYAVIESSGR